MSNDKSKAMSRDRQQYIRMTQTPVGRLVVQMAIPTIVSMIVTALYNLADTLFVSWLGTSAAGAVGVGLPLMAIIQAFGFTLGMGSGARISRLLGEKNKDESERVAIVAFVWSVVVGVLITVFGLIWLEPLVEFMGATPTMREYAKDYMRWILIGAPFMTGTFVLNNQLRSQGKAKLAMLGTGSGAVLNVVLDPIFIFTLDMSVTGAAVATAISQAVSFGIMLCAFLLKRSVYDLTLRKFTFEPSVLLLTLKNGLPSFFRQMLNSIATIMLNRAATPYGDAPFAAMTIVGKIFMMIFAVGLGIGQGYMPVVGYNYGAKRFDRVRSSMRFTIIVGTAMLGLLGGAMFAVAPWIMTLFVQNDPEVAEVGTFALRAQCCAMPFLALGVICDMTFQTIGRAWISTFLTSLRRGIFFIPLIYLLPRYIELLGVELAQPIADVLTFIVVMPFVINFVRTLPTENGAEAADAEEQ